MSLPQPDFMLPLLKLKELNSRLEPLSSKLQRFSNITNQFLMKICLKRMKSHKKTAIKPPDSITENDSFHSKKMKFEQNLRKLKRILDKNPEPLVFKRNFSDFLYFDLALSQISRVVRGLTMKQRTWAWNRLFQLEMETKIRKENENLAKIEKMQKINEIRCFYQWKLALFAKQNQVKTLVFILENQRKIRISEGFQAIYRKKLYVWMREQEIRRVFNNRKENRSLMIWAFERLKFANFFKEKEKHKISLFFLAEKIISRKNRENLSFFWGKMRVFCSKQTIFERNFMELARILGNQQKNLQKFAFLRLFIYNYRVLSSKINEKKLKKAAFLLKKTSILMKKLTFRSKEQTFGQILAFSNKNKGFSIVLSFLNKLETLNYNSKREGLQRIWLFSRKKLEISMKIQRKTTKNYIIQGYALFISLSKIMEKLIFLNKSKFFTFLKIKTLGIRDQKRQRNQKTLLLVIKINSILRKKQQNFNFREYFDKIKEFSAINKEKLLSKTVKKASFYQETSQISREFMEKMEKSREISDIFSEKLLQIKKKFALLETNKENSRENSAIIPPEIPKEIPFIFKELRPHFLRDDPLKKTSNFN